ncbi:hypothetical protein QUB47_23320 [Microcoleus sp. AT9_B5]
MKRSNRSGLRSLYILLHELVYLRLPTDLGIKTTDGKGEILGVQVERILKFWKNPKLGFMMGIGKNHQIADSAGKYTAVKELAIAPVGQVAHLKDFGQVKVFRTGWLMANATACANKSAGIAISSYSELTPHTG